MNLVNLAPVLLSIASLNTDAFALSGLQTKRPSERVVDTLSFSSTNANCFKSRIKPVKAPVSYVGGGRNSRREAGTTASEHLTGGYKGEFVDEESLYAASIFPIKPEELIALAKRFYDPNVRYGTKDNGECLADDFEFCAAVVGPLNKQAYLDGLANFDLEEAFDISGNIYGFYVDPLQPHRVWFFNRSEATHVGEFLGAKPTGKKLILPPQINFLDFNEEGKVKQYGFYTIDRRQGNTGGLGGAYGYMYGIGRAPPFPEARPFKPSLRYRFFSKVLSLLSKLQKKNKKDE